jgi:hypothetical protein
MIKVFFHFLIPKLEGKIGINEISIHTRHMGNFTETRGLRVFYSHKTLNLPCDVYLYTGHEQVYRRAMQNYFNTCRNSLGIKRRVQNIQSDFHCKTNILRRPVPTVQYVRSSFTISQKQSLSHAFNLKLHIYFSQLRPGFDRSVVFVGLMAEILVLKQVLSEHFGFPPSVSFLQCSIIIIICLLPALCILPTDRVPITTLQEWCVRCLSQRFHLHLNKISTKCFSILDTIWLKCY